MIVVSKPAWSELGVAAVVLGVLGVLMLLLGSSFQFLTVADRGDYLLIRFGPLPLFQKRIHYTDVSDVEIGQTTVLDGWGIHMSVRGGWVWNLSGRDDGENLARFLRAQIGDGPQQGKPTTKSK
jgi:hypothetical protein